jgi:hypothetical protein
MYFNIQLVTMPKLDAKNFDQYRGTSTKAKASAAHFKK